MLWAGLGTTPDVVGQLRRWATLFGLHETQMDSQNIEALALKVRSAIGERRLLLILDDAWALEDVLALQVGGSHCIHLITTRFPHLATRLVAADPVHLQELNQEQSLDLLHTLAPQVVEHEAEKARSLVQTVGGLPLALTLTGNYLRLQATSGQQRRLQAAFDYLTQVETRLHLSEPRGPTQRHPSFEVGQSLSLHTIIAVSDQQLSEQTRAALYALSVLPHKPNVFSEDAALAISDTPIAALDELLDTGLLESSGDERYSLHQTIADYARLHLQGMAPYERLIQYAHDVVETHKTDYELLDLESGTILAALESAYRYGKKQELVQVACKLIPFLCMRGNYSLAERHIQRAHEAAVTLEDERSIIMTLWHQGQIVHRQGKSAQAELSWQEGLTLARQIGDQEQMSALLKDLGLIAWRRGNYAQAEAYLEEGLLLARHIEEPERISGILNIQGLLAASRGDYTRAEEHLREGLALAQRVGEREHICKFLLRLGITVGEQGNFSQAEEYLQEGLALARTIGYREGAICSLSNLGDTAIDQGNFSQAEEYLQEGLALARQIKDSEWMSVLLINQVLLQRKQGYSRPVEGLLQEGLALARRLGIPQLIAYGLYESGHLFLEKQHVEAARASFCEMLALVPEGDRDLFALAHYGLARVAAVQGNREEALAFGETSLQAAGQRRYAKEVGCWLKMMRE